MHLLPRPIRVDRLAVEIADVDVVEERLDLRGDPSIEEGELRRLARSLEPRVDAEVDRNAGELGPEPSRRVASRLRERPRPRGVAVDPALDVECRLAVPAEDEEPHRSLETTRFALMA